MSVQQGNIRIRPLSRESKMYNWHLLPGYFQTTVVQRLSLSKSVHKDFAVRVHNVMYHNKILQHAVLLEGTDTYIIYYTVTQMYPMARASQDI